MRVELRPLSTDGGCRFCGSECVSRAFVVGDLNRRRSDAVFTYVRCQVCGSLSLSDPPANLGHYYGGDYFALAPPEALRAAAEQERWRFDEFVEGSVDPPGHAIEIGPGNGHFAYLLKRHGFKVAAVEQDAAACRYLREVIGVDVVETVDPLPGVAALPNADVIALWHSLEHVPLPGTLLDALAEKLLPAGILIVALPNIDSLGYRLLGRYWPHIDAPRHLTLPPADALLSRLTRAGLTIEVVRTDDPGARHYNWFAWDRALRVLRLPEPVHRRAAAGLTRLLASREARLGSSVTVVARRNPQ